MLDNLTQSPTITEKNLLTVKFVGFFSLFLGGLVIFGWYNHTPILIQLHPTFAPMQYNTALGFLLSGLGFLSIYYQKNGLASLIGAAILAIGSLTLLQYIVATDFGIDQLLMDHYITAKTSHIGRMAPSTAICFSLVGGFIVLNNWVLKAANSLKSEYRGFLLITIGSLVFILGVVALISYVLQLEAAYGWVNITRMAVHTSVGFLMLGAAGIHHAIRCTPGSFSIFNLKLLPLVLALVLFLLTIALWEEIGKKELQHIDEATKKEVALIEKTLLDNITDSVVSLQRMAQRWETRNGTPKEEWLADAYNYVNDNEALTAVEWVDNSYHVRWVEPLKGNEKAIGLNIAFNAERKAALRNAADASAITITPPLYLVQGYSAIIAYVPININGKFEGFIVGIYNIAEFLKSNTMQRISDSFDITIMDDDKIVHTSVDPQKLTEFTKSGGHIVPVYNRKWDVYVTPKKSFIAQLKTSLPVAILISGLAISLLLGFATYYALVALQRSKSLEEGEVFQRLILGNLPDIVFVKDSNYRVINNNPVFEELFSTTLETPSENSPSNKEWHIDVEEFLSSYDELAFKDGYADGEKTITLPTGVQKTLYLQKIRFENLAGEGFLLCIGRDITEREKLIKQLSQSNDDLQNFAYVASHDLKSPLRAIDNLSQWIEEDIAETISGETKENMKLMRTRVKRMEKLLDSLLEYARLDRKLDGKDQKYISGKELLETIVELVDCPETFTINVDEGFAALELQPMPLQQVLFNLIANAIKHHDKPAGNIRISVTENNKEYLFSVSDDGPGIAPEYQDKVFEMFQTLNSRDKVEGSGMGLALVKKLIDLVGGKITLESQLGEGATFRFTWPKS